MRNPCPRSLDSPIERWGFTYLEYTAGLVSFGLTVYYLRAWGLFVAPLVTVTMAGVRRGQHRAFFLHLVHRLDLVLMPGLDSYSKKVINP